MIVAAVTVAWRAFCAFAWVYRRWIGWQERKERKLSEATEEEERKRAIRILARLKAATGKTDAMEAAEWLLSEVTQLREQKEFLTRQVNALKPKLKITNITAFSAECLCVEAAFTLDIHGVDVSSERHIFRYSISRFDALNLGLDIQSAVAREGKTN